MNKDDLPPLPRKFRESFGGEIGSTVGRALWLVVPMGIIAAIVYFAAHMFGH